MNKKNIALIIPSLRGGGAEKTVSRLSYELDKRYNLYIILFNNINKVYEVKGHVIDLKLPASNNIFTKSLRFLKKLILLKEIKNEYEIDISISFMEGPNILNILSRSNDKIIVSVRNYLTKSTKGKEQIYVPFIKFFYNKADHIISASKTVEKDLINNFNVKSNKVQTIYNFLDIDNIKEKMMEEIEDEYKYIFNKQVLINVGRLEEQKGQEYLIKSFKYVNDYNPDINLILLGKGLLFDKLQKLIKDLDLQDNVFLLGFKSNPYKFMYHSKMYLNSSLYEGFGNVITEAMTCDLPVITADCPSGVNEIISPNTINGTINNYPFYADYGIITKSFLKIMAF